MPPQNSTPLAPPRPIRNKISGSCRLRCDPTCSSLFRNWQYAELLHHGEIVADGPVLGYPAIFQAEHVGQLGGDVAGTRRGQTAEARRAPDSFADAEDDDQVPSAT